MPGFQPLCKGPPGNRRNPPGESRTMPRLLDQVREATRRLHHSIHTEDAYVQRIRRFILFHGKSPPLEMGETEVIDFLDHLAVGRHVAASTQRQAVPPTPGGPPLPLAPGRNQFRHRLSLQKQHACVVRPDRLPKARSGPPVRPKIRPRLPNASFFAPQSVTSKGVQAITGIPKNKKDSRNSWASFADYLSVGTCGSTP